MRIALTGSSSGIGRALAERLIQKGNEVWGLARSDQSAFAQTHAPRFQFSRCDVTAESEVAAAAAAIEREWGGVDALIACAGNLGTIGRTTVIDAAAWMQTVHTNLGGTFLTLRAFWPLLLRAVRRGKVVCFSGGGGTKARPGFSAYGVAKTAIVRLVETVAVEEHSVPIDINAVAPGAIHTAMTEEIIKQGPDVAGAAEHAAALKLRAQEPAALENALELVEWLLSPGSDGINGRLLSAQWDPWRNLDGKGDQLDSDLGTLRRITPETRGTAWPES